MWSRSECWLRNLNKSIKSKSEKHQMNIRYKHKINARLTLVLTMAFAIPINAVADDASALAKKSQNTISTMISVPFENNANFNSGPDNKVLNRFS